MSQVVVGLAYSVFGGLGAMAACQSKDVTYRRKTPVKKDEE
jgi:multidrug transporter EmrE-like cation transporter